MPENPSIVIHRVLEGYAQRGVFRSFSQTSGSRRTAFRFQWILDLPFHLVYDGGRRTLHFPNLLPGIAPRSSLDRQLRRFIEECCAPERPEHRRIDTSKLTPRLRNRGGAVSLSIAVRTSDYSYAVRKAVNLVNEIFLDFLTVRHYEYFAEQFRMPEE